MDFSLAFTDLLYAPARARQKDQILATNAAAYTEYGLQLKPEESEMILKSAEKAMNAENLVQLGDGIVPCLIHWFLPSGYLGRNYAAAVAALTEGFYQIRGSLQELYDTADDPKCFLSDHAILDYMYRIFVSPSCAGDIPETIALTERILCSAMRRLLELRAAKRQEEQAAVSQEDPIKRALYADILQQEAEDVQLDREYEAALYDYEYHENMYQDMFGNFLGDYDEEAALHTRGTFAEELEESLRRDPALLLPSAAQEAEWDARAEEWEERDRAAEGGH